MGSAHPSGARPMKWLERFFFVAFALTFIFLTMKIGFDLGVVSESQKSPMACEPKCEFVYRGTKLINVTCPDSTGVTSGQR